MNNNGNGVSKWVKVVGIVFGILLVLGSYIGSYSVLRATVRDNKADIKEHSNTLLRIDRTLIEIANNQKWMMKNLGRR